jgi:hypothetical protein
MPNFRSSFQPVVLLMLVPVFLSAQTHGPEVSSWLLNTVGGTGYNGLPANVQRVQYSTAFVYVSCSGIPSYTIGPWAMNPNTPANQSYNNQNIWHQNAVVVEATSFDATNGHPAPGGRYHYHQNPKSLYTPDPNSHSPVLGYAFDGYPIYGPYAYANVNGTGGIARMRSSYRLRSITQRTTLPDGTVLSQSQYGPSVSAAYPLGYYVEDFEYAAGLGDLDEYNGRFAVTPEYPLGIYAYYFTINPDGSSAYPYVIGPRYSGVVATENFGAGRAPINEPVVDYNPSTGVIPTSDPSHTSFNEFQLHQNYPNPFNPETTIRFLLSTSAFVELQIYSLEGKLLRTVVEQVVPPGLHTFVWDAKSYPTSIRWLHSDAANGAGPLDSLWWEIGAYENSF